MAKKKRRTELDIDPSILAGPEEAAPAPPEPAEKEPEPAPAPKPVAKRKINKAKLLMVVSVGMGSLSLLAAIGWGVVSYVQSRPEPVVEVKEEQAAMPQPVPKPVIQVEIPPMFEFKPFLTNIGKGGGRHLVKITFTAQMSDVKVSEEIKMNLVLIRENIYYFLQGKTLEDFHNEKKKDRMAVDMAIVLNRSIQSGNITKVLVSGLAIN